MKVFKITALAMALFTLAIACTPEAIVNLSEEQLCCDRGENGDPPPPPPPPPGDGD